jgi:hypothetical protein
MEFASLPVVDPSSVDETQQLLIVSPDSLTPKRVQIRGAPGLFFAQFDPAQPGLLEDNSTVQSLDLDNRKLFDRNGDLALEYGGTPTNQPGLINFPSGIIAMPGLPTADPADGTGKLWMDPITRVVQVGT